MKKAKEVIEKIEGLSEASLDPVGGQDDGALKFVFKIPDEPGPHTFNFLDGSTNTLDLGSDSESLGKFAFVSKNSDNIFQTWDSKPSKDQAHDVLQRVKGPRTQL